MRKKILQAILLAVAVTGLALGGPLVYTTVLLVENTVRTQQQENASRIADQIDDQYARGQTLDLDLVRHAVPRQGVLKVVDQNGVVHQTGPPISGGTVSASASTVPKGSVELSIPDDNMRSSQLSEGGLVMLLLVLSVSIGTVVATLTARRLAEPLQHVAATSWTPPAD